MNERLEGCFCCKSVFNLAKRFLQAIMRSGMSYINDFFSKLKNLKKVPGNAITVTADVVELYRSIPHNEGLEVLKK